MSRGRPVYDEETRRRVVGATAYDATCSECGNTFEWIQQADVENGPRASDLDDPPTVCDPCVNTPCAHGVPGGTFCSACEEQIPEMSGHVHGYVFNRYCGAQVCVACEDHKGLVACYCGWARSGGDGRRELIEAGETLEPEEG